MYQFELIKLIIWDMDETFWEGTISEGDINIPKMNSELIKKLTDIGIVNSICSKNNWQDVKMTLENNQLLEYFVFPSVNWEAKGSRVAQIIRDMQLRPVNVLFIDDNPSNREEVLFYNAGIMVEGPGIISDLIEAAQMSNKLDLEHKRLRQYRILEQKKGEKSNYSTNVDFLRNSNIRVTISTDCINNIERIHDLIMRSNQLNFTKQRSSIDELVKLVNSQDVNAGYVAVKDKFGDYGIVGFYALKNNELIHFTFSCRTLGMGIEQYVYSFLGRPQLNIVGEVVSNIDSGVAPDWINQKNSPVNDSVDDKMNVDGLQEHMVLVKGPCDLFQIYPYIASSSLFDTEFTYTTDTGVVVESAGHTTNIVQSFLLNENQKHSIIDNNGFLDMGMYSDLIFRNEYKVVFLSILADANLGVYKKKNTGEMFAFMEYLHPLTDETNWPLIVSGELNTCGYHFSMDELKKFSEQYDFVGRNTPQIIIENLEFIRNHLNKNCILVVLLGGELPYEKNTIEAYKNRHVVHKNINFAVRNWAESVNNVELIDVNNYLVDQSCFYDHFNHYTKPIYYSLAKDMVTIINKYTDSGIHNTSRLVMVKIKIKEMLAPIYYKLKGLMKVK